MTNLEKPSHHEHFAINYDQQLSALFAGMHEITQRHTQQIPGGVFALDDDAQQALMDTLNPYIHFEFTQYPDLQGLPVRVRGTGMTYLSNAAGELTGKEFLYDADELTGTIAGVCVFPTPTKEWIRDANESDMELSDEVLSPILILTDGTLLFDRDDTGTYQKEADLGDRQACVPLVHYLRVSAATY